MAIVKMAELQKERVCNELIDNFLKIFEEFISIEYPDTILTKEDKQKVLVEILHRSFDLK